MRRAAREQMRNGANQIKIMAGGGVASPTDPIDGTQYSLEELRAICEEAEAANIYAMAHAYSPRADHARGAGRGALASSTATCSTRPRRA